jgi:hypothetical protein
MMAQVDDGRFVGPGRVLDAQRIVVAETEFAGDPVGETPQQAAEIGTCLVGLQIWER